MFDSSTMLQIIRKSRSIKIVKKLRKHWTNQTKKDLMISNTKGKLMKRKRPKATSKAITSVHNQTRTYNYTDW
jgi:hypothetical protein